ncbi:ABC transporter permease [Paenibacillus sp. 598K]|uniref:ABC transporter permease n=1 Tax=Paenibacillus sp. 598K TaxID=1117987 RepID=UPI000FF969DA|nr:ABC transporter permease [Paenibacillus sp. 598K]GBF77963.1 ABC transporter permease [Paenibacillus sp. 598K]
MRKAISAEASKLMSLPAAWLAVALALLVAPAIAALRAFQELSEITKGTQAVVQFAIGFEELAFGVTGVIILGVIAISSEYYTESEESGNGRQMVTSLLAAPSRFQFFVSKAVVVASSSAILAILTIPVTMGVIRLILGEYAPVIGVADVPRLMGVVLYWTFTALLALGITFLTRHAALPLAFLILNTSVMTVSYLLTRITRWANYLPDMAGIRMFHEIDDAGSPLSPLGGGLVMTVWVLSILSVAAFSFCRRDV